MSISLDQLLEKFKRSVSDLTGIDVAASGVKVVRLQRGRDELVLSGAAILPPIDLAAEDQDDGEGLAERLPPALRTRHACLTIPASQGIVKLLSFPGQADANDGTKIVNSLGLKDPSHHRMGYEILTEGTGRGESRVLAAAVPEEEAAAAVHLLSLGVPVPHSLEISGLATLTAFLNAVGDRHGADAVGCIEFGASTSTFALFNRKQLALVRRFRFGTDQLVAKLAETLGLDLETATGVLANNSFDISNTVNESIEPLLKQLVVSRDFVERRENCHVSTLYASGALLGSHDAVERIGIALGIDVKTWSPLENLNVADHAMPPELEGQEWRLASAIGSCIGALEEG